MIASLYGRVRTGQVRSVGLPEPGAKALIGSDRRQETNCGNQFWQSVSAPEFSAVAHLHGGLRRHAKFATGVCSRVDGPDRYHWEASDFVAGSLSAWHRDTGDEDKLSEC